MLSSISSADFNETKRCWICSELSGLPQTGQDTSARCSEDDFQEQLCAELKQKPPCLVELMAEMIEHGALKGRPPSCHSSSSSNSLQQSCLPFSAARSHLSLHPLVGRGEKMQWEQESGFWVRLGTAKWLALVSSDHTPGCGVAPWAQSMVLTCWCCTSIPAPGGCL